MKIGSERKLVHVDHLVKVFEGASISDSQELIISLPFLILNKFIQLFGIFVRIITELYKKIE